MRSALVRFIEHYRAKNNVARLYLMGFSQGAILSVAAGLSAPELVQGVVSFSGRFPAEYAGVVAARERLVHTPFWLGHGTEDRTLPVPLGRAMRDTWHQDVTNAVQERIETEGYGPWSIKADVLHVQPPAEVLEHMISVRLHLDPCGEENGALRVLSGSHTSGRISDEDI